MEQQSEQRPLRYPQQEQPEQQEQQHRVSLLPTAFPLSWVRIWQVNLLSEPFAYQECLESERRWPPPGWRQANIKKPGFLWTHLRPGKT